MRDRLKVPLLAAMLLTGSAGLAVAGDMSVCLSSGGDWKATGAISSASSMMGAYSIDFAEPVKAERMVKPTPMNPEVPGDCMVKAAGGLGDLPKGCKAGGSATVQGRLSFDAGIAIVNIASSKDISCN
ncbi:MAG TPA: hypothetical protein VFB16_03180 [Bauldia sp.]|nr:hypothetical protein [Bauldia sp.]